MSDLKVFRVRLQIDKGEFTIIRAESSREAAKLFVSAMEARHSYLDGGKAATVAVAQHSARWIYQVDLDPTPRYVATLIAKTEHAR